MKTQFKVGDRVAMYSGKNGRGTGIVQNVFDDSNNTVYRLSVLGDDGVTYNAHPKQCRKLKPRAKSVRITRKELAAAWDHVVAISDHNNGSTFSITFKRIADKLGFQNET